MFVFYFGLFFINQRVNGLVALRELWECLVVTFYAHGRTLHLRHFKRFFVHFRGFLFGALRSGD